MEIWPGDDECDVERDEVEGKMMRGESREKTG